jgi:hypothetical protein
LMKPGGRQAMAAARKSDEGEYAATGRPLS